MKEKAKKRNISKDSLSAGSEHFSHTKRVSHQHHFCFGIFGESSFLRLCPCPCFSLSFSLFPVGCVRLFCFAENVVLLVDGVLFVFGVIC